MLRRFLVTISAVAMLTAAVPTVAHADIPPDGIPCFTILGWSTC